MLSRNTIRLRDDARPIRPNSNPTTNCACLLSTSCRLFIQQAFGFFEAAQNPRIGSRPLLYYYWTNTAGFLASSLKPNRINFFMDRSISGHSTAAVRSLPALYSH